MEPKERFRKLAEKYDDDPEFIYEGLVLRISERIAEIMKDSNLTRSGLAEALSCSPAYVTKLLRGSENLTLKKLAELSHALGAELSVDLVPRTRGRRQNKLHHGEYNHGARVRGVVAEKRNKRCIVPGGPFADGNNIVRVAPLFCIPQTERRGEAWHVCYSIAPQL